MADAPKPTQPGTGLQRYDLLLSVAVLGLLVVFLIPLPTLVLDLLLAFNLSATILLLLITLTVRQPLEFSTFPSLLLLLTLYRLSLNVATTRLILLNGNAGEIVLAFGKFVVGGNLIVGMVIFLILILIQFIVITRGASRVSEVAARFTLDSMPGKQMAIDAEMNAGLINETEARRRRSALMRESEFYGTMDGASRFVRGDAIAAVVITGVNLIGGIIIGLMKGMPVLQAIQTYSILTIGEGLLAQIPALITATASGMLVVKATSESSLGQELGNQLDAAAAPIRLGSYILLGLAVMPGMPTVPFLVLAGALYFLSGRFAATRAAAAAVATAGGAPAAGGAAPVAAPKSPVEGYLEDFLQNDRISLEIGAGLVMLVSSNRGPGLLDRIGGLRRDLARQSGLWVPAVRVRDNIQLDPPAYRVLINNREVARGEVRPDLWLAIDPGGAAKIPLAGEEAREPAFGLPARWIPEPDRNRAEVAGYTVVDAPSVVITHLGEVVRRHASELLSREDLKAMVDKVREASPAVVDDLVPVMIPLGTLHRVLTLLLDERVPISNLGRIMESLAVHATTVKDPGELAERVRADIGRAVVDRFRDANGRIRAVVLDPRLEVELRRGVQGQQVLIDPGRLEQLTLRLAAEIRKANNRGYEVALLCDASLRRAARNALGRALHDLSVVSYQEIPNDVLMEPVAVIRPEDLTGAAAVASTLFESPTR
ncbi:flagellar biosynthesis protein : Flagellar biosynthesis protein FlhA OS=uncultured planctomycete GN=HGMM_F11F07C14 PE=4 SV=1: FHIPEP [Gemmataceae bacterium]|nr:flagellar biosynthesis protein : Flagellar biosynthesis protein FlhA OS=uncultured planctomycete GN=HGMM_F11F07C14 PE=4 SV=1: FHIPEP [Gemmataceae bacterium]VTT97906.1 flagellar biosynthesis protein : Flagellar biosynthesis protein FlhA OS=uncultured planctomycete GN=HGMM_F11F07C14 PE=4 SV=1: FHIPEP [Gemmataceae bacterium]